MLAERSTERGGKKKRRCGGINHPPISASYPYLLQGAVTMLVGGVDQIEIGMRSKERQNTVQVLRSEYDRYLGILQNKLLLKRPSPIKAFVIIF